MLAFKYFFLIILVIQHIWGQKYESTIAMIEISLSIGAGIVCMHRSFIGNRSIILNTFNFYWYRELRNDAKVLTVIKKELINKIIIDNRKNLVDYLNFFILDI